MGALPIVVNRTCGLHTQFLDSDYSAAVRGRSELCTRVSYAVCVIGLPLVSVVLRHWMESAGFDVGGV